MNTFYCENVTQHGSLKNREVIIAVKNSFNFIVAVLPNTA